MFERVEIGNCVLYHGDNREVMPSLLGVDSIVTDPPYGIADKWKGGEAALHGWARAGLQKETRNEWDAKPASQEQIDMILRAGKQHVIWGGNYFALPPSRCWLVWNKPERGFTLAECELAWTDFDNVARVFDWRRSDPGREHPTQKPVELMRWCVKKTSGTVCDPFMGSGTTLIACVQLGRPCIGIEAHRPYFDLACRRVEEAMGKGSLFESVADEPGVADLFA